MVERDRRRNGPESTQMSEGLTVKGMLLSLYGPRVREVMIGTTRGYYRRPSTLKVFLRPLGGGRLGVVWLDPGGLGAS